MLQKSRAGWIAVMVMLCVIFSCGEAAFAQTPQLSPRVYREPATPQTQREMSLTGQLKFTPSEREVLTSVTVTGTTTDGRSLNVKNGWLAGPGTATLTNSSRTGAVYYGRLYDSRLSTIRIKVSFKRYYKVGGNWHFDREYTRESNSYRW